MQIKVYCVSFLIKKYNMVDLLVVVVVCYKLYRLEAMGCEACMLKLSNGPKLSKIIIVRSYICCIQYKNDMLIALRKTNVCTMHTFVGGGCEYPTL
jgi:hypothetical protein